MNKNILSSLTDCFRDSLSSSEALILSLQIMAWAKLSNSQQLPENLRLSPSSTTLTASALSDVFQALANLESLGSNAAAFAYTAAGSAYVDSTSVVRALTLAYDLAQSNMLGDFNFFEKLDEFPLKQLAALAIPNEVADFMLQLVGSLEGKTVYCPYDTFCQLASRAKRLGADVYAEISLTSPLPWLNNIFTDSNIHTAVGNPIHQPNFVQGGKLQKFDITVSFPLIGVKYENQVLDRDWFDRFPEKTTSGTVLTIRHILAQTLQKAVIAVPNGLLFSIGAERALREDLLNKGIVEAVIDMPPALLPGISIPFAIIVLNLLGLENKVRFVDGSAPPFSSRDGRGRTRLNHWKALLKTYHTTDDIVLATNIPIQEVLKNDAQLQAKRYVLPPEQQQVEQILEISSTCNLSDVVDFVRPLTAKNEGDLTVFEVGATDFSEYGFVLQPERKVTVSSSALKAKDYDSFLQPRDIVIATKGSIGKVAILPDEVPLPGSGGWVAGQSYLILRTNNRIDPRVLFMYLRSEVGQILLRGMASGATIPLIQLRELQKLRVILLSPEDAQGVIQTFNQLVDLQNQIERLKHEQQVLSTAHWTTNIS